MKNTTFQFSKPQLDRLREHVLGDLESMTELPAYDKREKCYRDEYTEARQLAEYLGADLGNLPKRLTATAKQAAERRAADKAHMADLIRAHEKGLPFPRRTR